VHYRSSEVRAFGLALAGLLMVTVPIAAHANGPSSNMKPANAEPAPGIMLVWDGSGSGRPSGAIGAHPTAGHTRQWNGGWVPPHWGRTVTLADGVGMAGRVSLLTGSGFLGARSLIIPFRTGAARQAGGVIRSGRPAGIRTRS